MRPKCLTVRSTISSTCSGFRTSSCTASGSSPRGAARRCPLRVFRALAAADRRCARRARRAWCDREPDARAAAGDDRDLSVERCACQHAGSDYRPLLLRVHACGANMAAHGISRSPHVADRDRCSDRLAVVRTRCWLRRLPRRRPHGDADVQLRREPLVHPRGDRRSAPQLLSDDDADAACSEMTTERRTTPTSEAFARLFEAVHEGVYIGALDAAGSETLRGQSRTSS